VRKTVRLTAALGLVALALAGCGGSGSDERAARGASGEERSLVFVNRLDAGMSAVPYTPERGGQPANLPPGGRAEFRNAAVPGENDVCVALGQSGKVVRVAFAVVNDTATVRTVAKCPGVPPQRGEPQASWRADDRSGAQSLDPGIAGWQLCVERPGRLEASVRIEPTGAAC